MNLKTDDKKLNHFLKKEFYEKAVLYLQKNIFEKNNVVKNSLFLSDLYIHLKNCAQAILTLENLISHEHGIEHSTLFDIYEKLGNLYYDQNEIVKSFKNYQRAVEINKTAYHIYARLCFIYLDSNNLKKAENILTFLLKNDKNNLLYQSYYAYLLIITKQFEKAKQILFSILSHNNEFQHALYFTGYYYYQLKNYEKAKEYFEKSSTHNELKWKSNYLAGKSEFYNSHFRSCIKFLESIKKITNTNNASALDLYYTLAICYENIKDYKKALNELRKIHKINPDYKDIQVRLVSENYKNIANSYLLEYMNFEQSEYLDFCHKFLIKINLISLDYYLYNNNIIIFNTKVNKLNHFNKLLNNFINYSKKQKQIVIFCRNEHISEQLLENICKSIKFKFKNGTLLTSEEISPLALSLAHNKQIKVIIPNFLNNIMKEMTE